MIFLFDAHAHLQDPRLVGRESLFFSHARDAGVTEICTCGTTPSDWPAVERMALHSEFPDFSVSPCFGVHPWYVENLPEDWLERLESMLLRFPCAGVGEIGMDGIRTLVSPDTQARVLRAQLALAVRLGRPVALHGAKVWGRLLEEIRPFSAALPGILVHGFGGSPEMLRQFLLQGAFLSFGGSVCNPAAVHVRETVRQVPDDRLLLETDSPDLFPRGGIRFSDETDSRRPLNQPANLLCVAKTVAQIRGVPLDAVAAMTTENARRLLNCRN